MKKLLAAMFVALLMVGFSGADSGSNSSESNQSNVEMIDLDDNETRNWIIAEAIDSDKLEERGEKGEKLYYAPNQQTPHTGWAKWMYGNGRVKALGQFKDGKKDGLLTAWYGDWQKLYEQIYKDGKEDGLTTAWWNGQKINETNYKDGVRDGPNRSWYHNGEKKFEENYKDGKLWTAVGWKPNGEKCPATNFVDGNGVVVVYNEEGTERVRLTYQDGERVKD